MRSNSSIFLLIMLSFSFLILFTMSFQVFATELNPNNRTSLYIDPKNKFELYYPFDWEIAPKNSTFPYYGETTEVVFKPKGEIASPLNQVIFSISISDVRNLSNSGKTNSSIFLDDVVAERVNSFKDPSSIYGGLDVKLLGNNITHIDDVLSRELVFLTQGLGTFDMDIFTINKGFLYHFVFMSPQSQALEFVKQIQQMKSSFKFK